MRRSFPLALVLAVALAIPAVAAGYASPTWNLNGTYTLALTCVTGCVGDWPHSMTVTATSDTTGDVTGSGYFPADPGYTWTLSGTVTGWNTELHVLYTGKEAGYRLDLSGTIDQHGGMSGTGSDNYATPRTVTWRTTGNTVDLYEDRCTDGSYPGYAKVWSTFVPATGATVVTPALDGAFTYKLEASGTYFAGGTGPYDIQADAEYSQDAIQRAADAAWTDSVHLYGDYGESLLELKVNGGIMEWGAYNAGHRYARNVAPTGAPLAISVSIYDLPAAYYNNTGGLCVALYADLTPTGQIVSPADGGTYELGAPLPIESGYFDDNPGAAVFWAVRVDENASCANVGDNQYWGNVDGDHDAYTWSTVPGGRRLLSSAPTATWPVGDYCFVFNPDSGDTVPADEAPVRLISRFTLADSVDPTITFSGQDPTPNGAGWNNAPVTLTWSCTDGGSGVVDATVTRTLPDEGVDQSATGTCADTAGNTAFDTRSGIDIDLTDPGITWSGGPADDGSSSFGSVPAAPTCTATDALSGPGACTVEGWGATVGRHTLTATAFDLAGNSLTETRTYTVGAWRLSGFYQPVEMDNVWNIIKAGQTVPLKFEVFAGDVELADTAIVKAFTTSRVACPSAASVTEDELPVTTTGGTGLRYDTADGQFIQTWKAPKGADVCYRATMSTTDGSSLVAFFRTR